MSSPVNGSPANRSTPDIVAEKLRDEILVGAIAPGERINVRKVGARLEFSHIPIREALRVLEDEGLVETKPNVGAVAAGVSLSELEDVYDLRRMIEPTVAQQAVARMSDAELERARAALRRLEEAEGRTDGIGDAIITAHREFHWALLAPGASSVIERTIRGLWHITERYLRLTRGAALPVADAQHRRMLELCETGDGEGMAKLLAEHLHLAKNALTILYEQEVTN